MVSIEKIKARIAAVIDREIAIAQKEIEEFEQKIHDNEEWYGLGGWYTQFEKAKQRRERHIEDLEALKSAQARTVKLETLKLYPWYCPSCQEVIYTTDSRPKHFMNNTIDCPRCLRPIYKAANWTTWNVEAGSKYSDTRPRE